MGAGHQGYTLLVEDDDETREALARLVEARGYRVHGASDGKEALAKIRLGSALPCLILTDLSMPNMSGADFRRQLLRDRTLAEIPVVLLSGDQNVKSAAEELKADDYLIKPVDVSRLCELLDRHCGRPRGLSPTGPLRRHQVRQVAMTKKFALLHDKAMRDTQSRR